MLIQIKKTDYIVGIWMVERNNLGKVFIILTKDIKKDEWILYIRYNYVDQCYNMFWDDNDWRNTTFYKNVSEIDMIKICNDKMNELAILFSHNKNKILIGGDISIYNKVLEKHPWLPTLSLIVKKEKRE